MTMTLTSTNCLRDLPCERWYTKLWNFRVVWHCACLYQERWRESTTFNVGEIMRKVFRRLWEDEKGQDLTEYGLLLVLISLAATAAMGTLATAINSAFSSASSSLTSAS
jgi:pilus assembly protein Flp/PilA